MRARDIIDVCSFVPGRWAARSAHASHTHAQTGPRSTWVALAILVSCCALTDRAFAESRTSPQWSWPDQPPSGADCLAHQDLERRIEQQLGGPLSEADFALSFSARIARTRDGFRLILVTEQDGQRGERTFEGSSCREVSDAAVLLIALSLDDARAREGAATSDKPPTTPTDTAAAGDPAQPDEAGAQPRTARREHWGLGAGGLLDVGTLPRAAAGFELGLSLSWARSRFALTALGLPPVRSERVPNGSRVEVALWAARLGYCHTLLAIPRSLAESPRATTRLSLGGCVGVELGTVSGLGVDLREAWRAGFVWAAGWVALRASLALGTRWAVSLEPALASAAKRGRFVSSDAQGSPDDELFTPALFAKRLSLAVELSF